MKKIKSLTALYASLIILLLCNSCKTATLLYLDKHPEKLAELCASKFPVKTDSISVDSTAITQGSERKETETTPVAQPVPFVFNCDSAVAAARAAGKNDGMFSINCPPCPPSTKTTVYKTDTVHKWHTTFVTKENTAAVALVQSKYDKEKEGGIRTGQKLFFYKRLSMWLSIAISTWLLLRVLRTWLSKFTWMGWLTKLL